MINWSMWRIYTENDEVSLLLKTQDVHKEALTKLVVDNHPYETACVVFMPVSGGHAPFMDWVISQTSKTDEK